MIASGCRRKKTLKEGWRYLHIVFFQCFYIVIFWCVLNDVTYSIFQCFYIVIFWCLLRTRAALSFDGRTVINFLSSIGIPDFNYMYVDVPLFVFYDCTENCSCNTLSRDSRPVAPSVVGGMPCSDDAGWMGAAAAAVTGRGRCFHYGFMDDHLLSFIGIPDLKYMYVRYPPIRFL